MGAAHCGLVVGVADAVDVDVPVHQSLGPGAVRPPLGVNCMSVPSRVSWFGSDAARRDRHGEVPRAVGEQVDAAGVEGAQACDAVPEADVVVVQDQLR